MPLDTETPFGLYDPRNHHDSCGMGFVADLSGWDRALDLALQGLARLEHRGGLGADAETGDGSGVLLALPRDFFWDELRRLEGPGGHSSEYGESAPEGLAVGQMLLPRDGTMRYEARQLIQREAQAHHFTLLGWRRAPTDPDCLGRLARETMPMVEQAILVSEKRIMGYEEERRLGTLRRAIEREARASGLDGVVCASLSHNTIVYKGLVRGRSLGAFYLDLKDPRVRTPFALFHERFSTNTMPSWALAQPFPFTAHNGEINAIGGNRRWLIAREREIQRRSRERDHHRGDTRLFDRAGSDSKNLDELIGRLCDEGYRIDEAILAAMPAACEAGGAPSAVRSFYRYHARRLEPFDGPAAVVFSDGIRVGACLDRNGLRPARYAETDDGLIVLASEAGLIDLKPHRIERLSGLGPGQALVVDLREKRVLRDMQLKRMLAVARPYGAWLRGSLTPRPVSSRPVPRQPKEEAIARLRLACGLTDEEVDKVVIPMAKGGKQPVGSMGNDTPLPPLSRFPRPIAHYLTQRFAQVTNPPIDPHRERAVMSLESVLGPRPPLLEAPGPLPRHLEIEDPILDARAMRAFDGLRTPPLVKEELEATFLVATGATALRNALDRLGEEAVRAVEGGRCLLVATDRRVDHERGPIPSVLVAGVLHEALVQAGLRHGASVICEAGDVWDAHGLALCIGAGADAVAPHLAFATVRRAAREEGGALHQAGHGDPAVRATLNYRRSLNDGLLQIMAKMGISTVQGYRGARLFEALGIAPEVIDRCLPGIPSRIGGVGFHEIATDLARRHHAAFAGAPPDADPGDLVPVGAPKGAGAAPPRDVILRGFYGYRREGEAHAVTPKVMKALQRACREGCAESYAEFVREVTDRPPICLRDLMELRPAEQPLPLEEVESVETIRRRFCGAAMSIGALSKEMHETLAIALNRIGGRSNSGEGGEDPLRFGTERESRIKQVASARFGVTTHYLVAADELEIKMAQGSKPGEGGHLPGIKVSVEIARLRHAMPGRTLISPPPHHDIYSIEDLAQLIFDLKQVNPRARVIVKLVSEVGVGTVAAGVAKAFADVIMVSGYEGGTGASPLGSIKYAGIPWELGLSETQQTLVRCGLRRRVTLRTDGGLRTGRDVVVAALLGAEEFGFGTMPLIAAGCVMQRRCHLNTCSVGVATQRPDLRERFRGTADHIVNYFTFVAEEVRGLLAQLGLRTLDAAIGRPELLRRRRRPEAPRSDLIDLTAVLAPSAGPAEGTGEPASSRRAAQPRNDIPPERAATLDDGLLKPMREALERNGRFAASGAVANVHRAVGTRLGGAFVRRLIARGEIDRLDQVEAGTVELRLTGTAGQSLGAFTPRGFLIEVVGQANDYVGKGLSGGEIVLRPNPEARKMAAAPHEHMIMGNTVMYGATAGALFAAGRAGERFCVRNSGALAVCEGMGQHGCEYMTGGVVVSLGSTGPNFGAGMTGGIAYVLDEDGCFGERINKELVCALPIDAGFDDQVLQRLVHRHHSLTKSPRAAALLADWEAAWPRFKKVVPRGPAGDPIVQRAATVDLVTGIAGAGL